ncbi:hypothetical protein H634G_05226 [Metarhizium anisopliae BRIP 53293]|uniref:Uncharacterized protein n=1 Tax=Metarhizium anisopliae BRIP 53293 TaxID=1291518 RepID=A0A0D9P060_METAN|nr:hypothetical protein H634G_05226 [Metarhizium anisopliae BRIP 53293]KJK90643.1 hypothetical protein H633G_05551 [Metarhizium anisopliae BRIP 53284]
MGAARPERALWQHYGTAAAFRVNGAEGQGPGGPQVTTPANWLLAGVPDDSSMSVAVAIHHQMQNHLVVAYQPVVLPHSAPKQGVSRTVVSSKVSRCGRPETPSCAIAVFLIGCAGPEPWDFPEPATVPSAMCQVELLHPPEAAGNRDTLVNPFADKKALQPDPASRFCMLASPSPLTTNPSSRAGPGPAC